MDPIPFPGDLESARTKVLALLQTLPRVQVIEDTPLKLHVTFTTKLGKFIDDVHFFFDEEKQVIHFRSASRKGWYDLRANRRRMKKITRYLDFSTD